MDLVFECQKALFSALQSALSITVKDKVTDNKNYPYICLIDSRVQPFNTHDYKGKAIYFIFGVYTKPDPGEGTYQAKTHLSTMCDTLDLKKFTLTSPAKMRICEFNDSTEISNNEVKAIQAIFRVLAHEQGG